ncbi:MAG: RlmE family RNA methyltransferase [Planctomycetota bacterium]|nr:RlmE family RNA methyltransferase [Planctomycetota bacterium]
MARRILHDAYFKKAKAEGYLARSAYKLQQIQESKRIIRAGDRVLDLGCAPGAWLQVAAEIAGPDGVVVGIDLKPVEAPMPENVFHLVGDVYTADPAQLRGQSGRPFDVVLSDMAPSTTGHGDDLVSARLCDRVIEMLPTLLRPGGNLAMKILEGGDTPRILKQLQRLFGTARAFKPDASRDVSRETYLIGTGYAPHP